MNCGPFARTGLELDLNFLMFIALGCFVIGLAMLFARHRGRQQAAAVVLAVALIVCAASLTPAAPSVAASPPCDAPANSLTVIQTSIMADLAPGIAPVPIAGIVVNNGADSTHIAAVKVEITSVAPAAGDTDANCDASDYILLDSLMPVGHTLAPGALTPFAGASIGFANEPTIQDDCEHAVVHLRYTANPG